MKPTRATIQRLMIDLARHERQAEENRRAAMFNRAPRKFFSFAGFDEDSNTDAYGQSGGLFPQLGADGKMDNSQEV